MTANLKVVRTIICTN